MSIRPDPDRSNSSRVDTNWTKEMRQEANAVGLIPVRLESTRLERKALIQIGQYPMIVHTLQRALMARSLSKVFVCTDSPEIKHVIELVGGQVIMTSPDHKNGTERILEAKRRLDTLGLHFNQYVDIQGDEPLIDPKMIDQVVAEVAFTSRVRGIMLPALPITLNEATRTSVVKVVKFGSRVVYLTRGLAPFPFRSDPTFLKHLSIISFRPRALEDYGSAPVGQLEQVEGIELLRALEDGIDIQTMELKGDSFSVDTIEDYYQACRRIEQDRLYVKHYKLADDHPTVLSLRPLQHSVGYGPKV